MATFNYVSDPAYNALENYYRDNVAQGQISQSYINELTEYNRRHRMYEPITGDAGYYGSAPQDAQAPLTKKNRKLLLLTV